ncbi:hypothetical protein RJT34_10319 [Clitoria ternatea]|uniref:Uncharacterized protein n=1 Tax=Clitoria ternatea TaxID=43366 RepID=A0AAN9K8H1_CLITE
MIQLFASMYVTILQVVLVDVILVCRILSVQLICGGNFEEVCHRWLNQILKHAVCVVDTLLMSHMIVLKLCFDMH